MKELLDLLEKYLPGHARTVRGASPEAISRLEAAAGRKLPAAQVELLRTMGEAPGRFGLPRLDFTAAGLTEHYEAGEGLPPGRFVVAAVDLEDPYAHYYIDAASPEATDGPVVRTDALDQLVSTPPDYLSFREMVFSMAFAFVRQPLFPRHLSLQPGMEADADGRRKVPPDALQRLDRTALAYGFRRLPETSDLNPLYERGDAAISAHKTPQGAGVSVQVAAQDDRELKRLAEILRDNAGLI